MNSIGKNTKNLLLTIILSLAGASVYSFLLSSTGMRPSASGSDIMFALVLSMIFLVFLRPSYISSLIASSFSVSILLVIDRFMTMFNKSLSAFDLKADAISDSLHFFSAFDLSLGLVPVIGLLLFINYKIKALIRSAVIVLAIVASSLVWAQSIEPKDLQKVPAFGKEATDIGRFAYLYKSAVERISQSKIMGEYTYDTWSAHYKDQTEKVAGAFSGSAKKPNIYIAVLESYFDFENSNLPEHLKPWNERYRNEIQPFVGSITSSVSGGGSVNTQFEALCGVPSLQKIEKFDWYQLLKIHDPECITGDAAKLAGYTTRIRNAGIPYFFDVGEGYKKLAWDDTEFLDKRSYKEHSFYSIISDGEMFSRTIDDAVASDEPSINYMLGFYGHSPFYNNPEKWPVVVSDPDLNDYQERMISQEHYRQQFIVDFIDEIREKDPSAVVLVFGDHNPPSQGYKGETMFKEAYSVPLVVYAGGELKTVKGVEIFETYQLAFDLASGGKLCKTMECYTGIERSDPKASDLYFSFASSVL